MHKISPGHSHVVRKKIPTLFLLQTGKCSLRWLLSLIKDTSADSHVPWEYEHV